VLGEFRPDGAQREWCDDEVLRQLRRRSLAALRREIEPVDAAALARFLPAWQGVGGNRQGLDGLVEALGILQGAAIPASALEVDVLASRVRGYRPADLDALCTAGEVVWIGAGAIGSADGRVGLYFRDQVALLAPEAGEVPEGPLHQALLDHLAARGASFWPEIVRAAADAGQPYDDPTVLAALWDLVWAGHVTNDSIGPLRAQLLGRPRRSAASARRPRPGRLTRLGPPAGAGRWSLVSTLLEPRPAATERAHARARQLLERYGVLTRESVAGEGVAGGFAGLYPVLEGLESRGQTRRGYFVAGLGAAQFALPGAVDRLRSDREPDPGPPLVLAATDPAQPFGAALPWPDTAGASRPGRAAGAFVVLRDGEPLVYVERGGRALLRFPGAFTDVSWSDALMRLVKDGRMRVLEIARVDGSPVRELPDAADALRAAGFVDGYRGLVARERSGR
jgi:ATP-dependent Lhr-like helicase